jgi:hypothetical protein
MNREVGRRVQAPGRLVRVVLYTRLVRDETSGGIADVTTSIMANMAPEQDSGKKGIYCYYVMQYFTEPVVTDLRAFSFWLKPQAKARTNPKRADFATV